VSSARKVTTKKTTPKKRTVKKPVSASKPKLHAKNMTLVVSVGDKDRDKLIEAMQDAVKKAVEKLGYSASLMSSYYILDGKVCLPKDYDPATQNFKPGAVPPPWAGGPTVNTLLEKVGQEEFKVEAPTYSPRENMDAIRPILEKNAAKRKPKVDEDDELEEIAWEAEDVDDEDLMEEVAKKSRKRAISKLKNTPAKKRVVKKPAVQKSASKRKTKIVPAKKTVTRKKVK
jgi:hypothetical protein